jgi:large repetitive protein
LIPSSFLRKLLPLVAALSLLAVVVLASTASGASSGTLKYGELPDPLAYGQYTPKEVNPAVFGKTTLQEPNSKGGAATGSNTPIEAYVRGSMWLPEGYSGKSPLLLFVHGNHGECDVAGAATGTLPVCTIYKRNDEGYAYMARNLASWGYTVVSLDQDELMNRQDSLGKGMHTRRLLIMAMLDDLKAASEGTVVSDANPEMATLLGGKLDMTRIGLMGHSRGGDAVASFVLYNQTLPAGERFPLRAVVSIAPVDYERHAPYGVPYMTMIGTCDGDVSNLQGARLYERSQYQSNDPYPRFQVLQVGGNHDAYNTVWQADGDDSSQKDVACGPDAKGDKGQVGTEANGFQETVYGEELTGSSTVGKQPNVDDPHNIRLSGEAGPHFEAVKGEPKPYHWGNGKVAPGFPEGITKLDPSVNTRMSGDPALMGDQEKMGLATVAAFFRRYVGGEGAFEPYLTGELAAEGEPSIPQSACPTSEAGKRIPCIDRVADSYTAPPAERMDVLRPDTEHPTTVDALGTGIEASGFENPYQASGGVQPVPAETPNGITWCDPDPEQAEPANLNENTTNYAVSERWCPQPAPETLGGQGFYTPPASDTESERAKPREQAPVNGSYGRQLSLAWDGEAAMGLPIPAADGNVSNYRALYMATAVNFFDSRNPARGLEGEWNPEAAPQNFTIAVSDAEGDEGTVEAADPDFGTATQQTLGSTSDRVHVMLRDLRVPLAEFAAQGVNLKTVRHIELRFGEAGMPNSGSIQLADVRFEQPASGYSNVFLESTAPNAGPGTSGITSGPNPATEIEDGTYKRADGEYEIPNVTTVPGANVWTVDDDKAQCPNAEFTGIQEAVENASPWDTIVVCPGVYEESSTPVNSELNPVLATGETNGLTIKKPLKIIGAGAGEVTIKPKSTVASLGGATGTLRDGGGNVITVSRQSLGSTEYDEEYVDISGVTIESGSTAAEAGVAFFNSSGRIADSVVKSIKPANGNGWGVVETDSQIGSGVGSPERQVTIADSTIKGYGAGGVLFDGSKGKADGTATNTERSLMNQVGYVFGSTIEGAGGGPTGPQTGIAYRSGARGEVTGSAVVDNQTGSGAGSSYGVLAADAGAVSVAGSEIAGNGGPGYGVYSANAAVTGVGTETVRATGDYWGTGGTPLSGETVLGPPDQEGVGGPVTTTPVATSAPSIAATPALMPDQAPSGEIVEPAGGEAVEVGAKIEPVVLAEDDYGVKSVALKVNGEPLATVSEAPYTYSWTPTAADKGTTVRFEATITDSSGQVTTSDVSVPVVATGTSKGEARREKEAREAAEAAAAEAVVAAEAELAAVKAKAEAAAKAAEAAAAEGKAAEDKAAAALKAAEDRVAKVEAELKAAEKAAPAPTIKAGKVTKDTKKGTARLGVTVSSPGSLVLSGPDVVKVSGHPTGPGTVQVLVKAKGKALKTLEAKGEVSVKVTITFTAGGKKTVKTATVTLVKK